MDFDLRGLIEWNTDYKQRWNSFQESTDLAWMACQYLKWRNLFSTLVLPQVHTELGSQLFSYTRTGLRAQRCCCFLGQPLWEFYMNYGIVLWGHNCDYRFNDALNKQNYNDFHQCKTGASCRETPINVTSRQGYRPGWQPAAMHNTQTLYANLIRAQCKQQPGSLLWGITASVAQSPCISKLPIWSLTLGSTRLGLPQWV